MKTLNTIAIVAALACCSTIFWVYNVPGFDHVEYDGDHDPRDVALMLSTFVVVYDDTIGERPNLSHLSLVEADEVNEASEVLGPYKGLCPSPSKAVFEKTAKLSDGVGVHELTHIVLWRTTGNPDSDIELTADGHCLDDGNGACSHAGGNGGWTLLHDKVIADTTDMLRSMGL